MVRNLKKMSSLSHSWIHLAHMGTLNRKGLPVVIYFLGLPGCLLGPRTYPAKTTIITGSSALAPTCTSHRLDGPKILSQFRSPAPSCLCHQRVGYDAQANTPGHYCKGKNHGCREAGAIYQAPARILLSTNEEVGPRPFSVQSTLAPKHLSPNEAKETFQVQLGCQTKFLCTTKTNLESEGFLPCFCPTCIPCKRPGKNAQQRQLF